MKLYYTSGFTRERISSMHEWFVEQGEESPFAKWIERIESEAAEDDAPDDRHRPPGSMCATTSTSARDALLAHHTQVPSDSFFFRVPLEVTQERHPWEEYVLARTLVDTGTADGEYETDLFAGLRVAASS